MSNLKIILTILSIIILINSCSENPVNPIDNGKVIKGITQDGTGNLLDGVSVYLIYNLVDKPSMNENNYNEIMDVGLDYFRGRDSAATIILEWQTNFELNNSGFEIQKKQQNDFEPIGFVEGKGTTNDTTRYKYIDSELFGGTYKYRLKQISFDGTFSYSDEIVVEMPFVIGSNNLEQNYPNPFEFSSNIMYSITQRAYCKLFFLDNIEDTSVVIVDEIKEAGIYQVTFNRPEILPNGVYLAKLEIKLEEDSTLDFTKSILKNTKSVNLLTNGTPNTVSNNGEFEIELSKLPLNEEIIYTGEADPTPLKTQVIINDLRFVLYKPGYKLLDLTYSINENESNEFIFTLEKNN